MTQRKSSNGEMKIPIIICSKINFDMLYDMMDAMCYTNSYLFTTRKIANRTGIDGRRIGNYMQYLTNVGAVSLFDVKGQPRCKRCIYSRHFEREHIPDFMETIIDNYCWNVKN